MSIPMTLRRSEFMLNGPLVRAGTPLEATIMFAFRDTFELDEVGAEDDFFELGGDSLTAEILALSILKRTGRPFKIPWLLYSYTPRAIAALLESGAPRPAELRRPPFFLVHGTDGILLPSQEFSRGLAPDQRLEIFELPGIRNCGEIQTSVCEIAAHYRTHLTTTYPNGPILLGGACAGSLIAIEMAAQLAEAGRPVQRLLLIDPSVPFNVQRYVERSVGVDLPWQARAMQWRHRLASLLLLGRASDGSEEADFDDDRLRRLRVFASRWRSARVTQESRNHDLIVSKQAKATVRAAYCHYRPRPHLGDVDVICSEAYRRDLEREGGAWGVILPRRHLHIVAETPIHTELFNAQAGKTAATLQLCLDRAIEKIPAGLRNRA